MYVPCPVGHQHIGPVLQCKLKRGSKISLGSTAVVRFTIHGSMLNRAQTKAQLSADVRVV